MQPDLSDDISDYLEQGWSVVGYSTAVHGALLHTVLCKRMRTSLR
jgi:hypothetical protein